MDGQEELIEREAELTALRNAVRDVRGSSGRLLVVEGEAGIGKTSLLNQLVQLGRDSGADVFLARCTELERNYAFGVVRQLFERHLTRLPDDERDAALAGAADLCRSVFDLRRTDSLSDPTYPTLHGLYWLISNLADSRPLVLCVDDLQWADSPSLRFLGFLAGRLADLPVIVVVTCRSSERSEQEQSSAPLLDEIEGIRLDPRPLSQQGVRELLRRAFQRDPDDSFVSACWQMTAGNPFMTQALLQASIELGLEPTDQFTADVRTLVPTSVTRATRSRLRKLPTSCADVARAISVLGDCATLSRVAELARCDPARAQDAVDALVRTQLAGRSPLRIVHPLIGAALAADSGIGEKQLLHQQAAALLRADGVDPEVVAGHLIAGGGAADEQDVDTLRLAAAQATARGAPSAAITYLRLALLRPGPPSTRAETLTELGSAEALAGDPAAADTFAQAAGAVSDSNERARLQKARGVVLYQRGKWTEAIHAFASAAESLGDSDSPLAAELSAWYACAAVVVPDIRARAIQIIQRPAESDGAPTTLGEHVARAQLAVYYGSISSPRAQTAQLAKSAWNGGRLLELEGPDGGTWNLVTGALTACGEYALSENIATHVLDAARSSGSASAFALASFVRATAISYQGRVDDVLADAQQALSAGGPDWDTYAGGALWVLAQALIEREELAEAERVLGRLEHPRPLSLERPCLLHARGQFLDASGQHAQALDDYLAAGALLTDQFGIETETLWPWRGDAALAAARTGDRDLAQRLLDEAAASTDRVGAPGPCGRVLRVSGLISALMSDTTRSLDQLRRAESLLDASPARLELARALVDHGSVLRRERHRRDARARLRRGLELASSLGARRLALRAHEELAASGERLRPPAPDGGLTSLTPSERRTAALAADGLSHAEIAQSLFLTVKTVETHLTRTYRKLGVRSKSELANRWHDLENGRHPAQHGRGV